MPRITTFLAYDDQAEEAAMFYVSIFKNSKILKTTRYGESGPGQKPPGRATLRSMSNSPKPEGMLVSVRPR